MLWIQLYEYKCQAIVLRRAQLLRCIKKYQALVNFTNIHCIMKPKYVLIYCGLVKLYGAIHFCEHWFKLRLITWRHWYWLTFGGDLWHLSVEYLTIADEDIYQWHTFENYKFCITPTTARGQMIHAVISEFVRYMGYTADWVTIESKRVLIRHEKVIKGQQQHISVIFRSYVTTGERSGLLGTTKPWWHKLSH